MPTATLAQSVAADLLRLEAVILRPDDPFTWASGTRSPIYCDNRITLSDVAARRRIRDGFAQAIRKAGAQPTVIAGTATAGIPHAAWLAEALELPLVYVRSKPKAHGRGNQIEGRLEDGATVVLVEDLVSTGGSALEAAAALRDAGAEIALTVAIFTYGAPAAARSFAQADLPLATLTDFDTLLDEAEAGGYLEADAVERVRTWHRDTFA
jgi:orotate phosphoribosyltransferase